MPAYIIAAVEVTDAVGFDEYRRMAGPIVAAFGGKFVVRGGKVETLEGDWIANRLVVIEFESVERAKKWWASDEYRAAKELRQRTTNSKLLIVEGV